MTNRFAFGVEYAGNDYHGWQYQPHATSVQAAVEQALSVVANESVRIICAGRTDTGVHATGQVCHFETQAVREEHSWLLGANTNLPSSIRITWLQAVPHEFHARFSATDRAYRYIILNRPIKSALLKQRVTSWFRPIDVERLQTAATLLVGQHDFSAFRTVHCQAHSPVRTLHRITVRKTQEFIYIDLQANAFLHHMVRNIVGSSIPVGLHEKPIEWIGEVLASRDRQKAGLTAPADGLYLTQVNYPTRFNIPEPVPAPFYG